MENVVYIREWNICNSTKYTCQALVSKISNVAGENSLSVPRGVQDLLSNTSYFIIVYKFNVNTWEKNTYYFFVHITMLYFFVLLSIFIISNISTELLESMVMISW